MQPNMNAGELVGFFEADGSIYTSVNLRKAKGEGHKMSLNLEIRITQVISNKETLEQVKKLAGGGGRFSTRKGKKGTNQQTCVTLTINAQSPSGKKVLEIFKTHPLRLPRTVRDLEILKLIKKIKGESLQFSTEDKAIILFLIYQNSSEIQTESTVIKKIPILERKEKLGLTDEQFDFYNKKVEKEYLPVIQAAENSAANNKNALSDDYLRGFFIGDGGLGVFYNISSDNVTPIFNMTITDPDPAFLSLIQKKLGCGEISESTTKNCYQFRIQDKQQIFDKVLPILSSGYLSPSKRKTLDAFKKACQLSMQSNFRTPQGWREFVELTYDLNKDGALRQQPKEDIISFGENVF